MAKRFDYYRAAYDLKCKGCPQPDEVFIYKTGAELEYFLQKYDLFLTDYYVEDDGKPTPFEPAARPPKASGRGCLTALCLCLLLFVLSALLSCTDGGAETYRPAEWYLENAADETAKYLRERGYAVEGVSAGSTRRHDGYMVLDLIIRLPSGTSPERIHEILRAADNSEFETDAYKAGLLLIDMATVAGDPGKTYDALWDTLYENNIPVWPTPEPTPRPTVRPAFRPAYRPAPEPEDYDPFGAADYADPDSFWDDYYDDFESIDDAEAYWEEFG